MSSKFPMVIEVDGAIKIVPDGDKLPVGKPFTVIETDYNPDRIVYRVVDYCSSYSYNDKKYSWEATIVKNRETVSIKSYKSFSSRTEAENNLKLFLDLLEASPQMPEALSTEESYKKHGRY